MAESAFMHSSIFLLHSARKGSFMSKPACPALGRLLGDPNKSGEWLSWPNTPGDFG